MNVALTVASVGGSCLSRVSIGSPRTKLWVVGQRVGYCLPHVSETPVGSGIASHNQNRSLSHTAQNREYRHWTKQHCHQVSSKRNLSTNQTTATVSDSDNVDEDIHRYRYQLYQYKICPFSNIAKVFLRYQRIPFQSVEVNPLTKAELGFSEKYRKVPIVTILDSASTTPAAEAVQQLNGTEELLSHDHRLSNQNDLIEDDDFASSDSSVRWQDFARTKLAPLLYPNICRTLGDSFRAFDYVHADSNSFSAVQRYSIQCVGSIAMYFASLKIKEKYEIDDVQVALEETLNELESELSNGGSRFLRPASSASPGPDLGDLTVFAVLKGLEGLPLWNRIFGIDDTQTRFPNMREWYASVDEAVENRSLQTIRYGYND